MYYLTPEILMNNYNEKAYIWQCGIIAYTMLFGYPPFWGKKENIIKSKIFHSKLAFSSKEFKTLFLIINLPAEEAINNQWLMIIINNRKVKLSDYIISNLIRLRTTIGLRKVTVSFLTNYIGINEGKKH